MDENKTFNISMPRSLLEAIDKQAEVEFRNRSDLIREAARTYIAQKGGMDATNKPTTAEAQRIKEILRFADFAAKPTIILTCAYRPQPNAVRDIFNAESTAIKLMEHPPKLRNMGWDLDTLDRARPVAGAYLEVTNGMHKLMRLYRDGQHVFAAGMDFFGWAVNKDLKQPSKFNLLSVAELIFNYTVLASAISETLEKRVGTYIFTIAISNPRSSLGASNRELKLAAYNRIGTQDSGRLSLEWAERSISVQAGDEITVDKVAYLIYSEFCYFFGMRSDELRYVTKDLELDKNVFLKAGR